MKLRPQTRQMFPLCTPTEGAPAATGNSLSPSTPRGAEGMMRLEVRTRCRGAAANSSGNRGKADSRGSGPRGSFVTRNVVIIVASHQSDGGGPLAQDRLYNYRSGWRQRTSGNPRTVHARRSHTVYECGPCNHYDVREPQRTWQASLSTEMRHRRGAHSCRPGGGCSPVEYLNTAYRGRVRKALPSTFLALSHLMTTTSRLRQSSL